MQLVIDIPPKEFEHFKQFKGKFICDNGYDLIQAIKNGTPHETVTEFADRCRECGGEKVLDKIRAEITEYAIPDFEYHGCGGSQKIVELEDVFEIIDKYKAESEMQK